MNQSFPLIVVTDYTFADLTIEEKLCRAVNCELRGAQAKTEAALIELCSEADAVITQFAKINANVINAMNRAKVIVRYGIGVDNVDLKAARAKNIPVCNVPDYCIDEVADHTLAFILALTRQVVPHNDHLKAGKWGLVGPLENLRCLRDQTVGVVGFGRIGRQVVQRLLAFKCKVVVYDPIVSADDVQQVGAEPSTFDDLLRQSDIVTLHCPSIPQTRKIMNLKSIGLMKKGAILINVGRGDLLDVPALMQGLDSGHLSAAALDVFDPEPIPTGHPILSRSNVVLAPHIASATPTASAKLRDSATGLAIKGARGEKVSNVVNGVR